MTVPSEDFIEICYECDFNIKDIASTLRTRYPSYQVRPYRIESRIAHLRRKGRLPLESGNSVSVGEILKGTSTRYQKDGSIGTQWVKTNVALQDQLEAFNEAVSELAQSIPTLPVTTKPTNTLDSDLATLYISNDIHFGALMWDKESGEDWNIDIARKTVFDAYDHLFATSPNSEIGIISDLGDLTEADNDKNMTPKSGNVLSVDSRYPKVLQVAYESLIYAIKKALTKHDKVYFLNINGNHDTNTGHAIREVIRMTFINEPRVVVDPLPTPIKYFQHGTVLLQFAHGDGMKMKQAGEVMAVDCEQVFSSTKYRFSHFGHTHVDKVIDTPICRVESHRNLPPNNHWAHQMGYRRQPGTMKSITYHASKGEVSRSLFTL